MSASAATASRRCGRSRAARDIDALARLLRRRLRLGLRHHRLDALAQRRVDLLVIEAGGAALLPIDVHQRRVFGDRLVLDRRARLVAEDVDQPGAFGGARLLGRGPRPEGEQGEGATARCPDDETWRTTDEAPPPGTKEDAIIRAIPFAGRARFDNTATPLPPR